MRSAANFLRSAMNGSGGTNSSSSPVSGKGKGKGQPEGPKSGPKTGKQPKPKAGVKSKKHGRAAEALQAKLDEASTLLKDLQAEATEEPPEKAPTGGSKEGPPAGKE